MLRLIASIFTVTLLVGVGTISGQEYPSRHIRIVTGGVGGQSDFAARQIAIGLSSNLGQQVIVDNRASGVAPGQIVSQAAPNGYTLLVAGSTLWIGPLMRKSTPFDAVRDFTPVSLTNKQPLLVVVHPSVSVKSVKELIALAKAKPGGLNYSSGVSGSASHLTAELFNYMAGVKIVGVPFSSGSSRMAALVGGEVQLEFSTPGSVTPHIKSGKLRALAVTSAKPSALAPGLPTVADSGLPGYQSEGTTGLFAPAKTPAAIVNRLNQEIARVQSQPEVKERFFNSGVEAVSSSPAELASSVKAEMTMYGKMIKELGIQEQ